MLPENIRCNASADDLSFKRSRGVLRNVLYKSTIIIIIKDKKPVLSTPSAQGQDQWLTSPLLSRDITSKSCQLPSVCTEELLVSWWADFCKDYPCEVHTTLQHLNTSPKVITWHLLIETFFDQEKKKFTTNRASASATSSLGSTSSSLSSPAQSTIAISSNTKR